MHYLLRTSLASGKTYLLYSVSIFMAVRVDAVSPVHSHSKQWSVFVLPGDNRVHWVELSWRLGLRVNLIGRMIVFEGSWWVGI